MKYSFYLKLTLSVISLTAHSFAMSTLREEAGKRRDLYNAPVAGLSKEIADKQKQVNKHSNTINHVLADSSKVSEKKATGDQKAEIFKIVFATALTDLRTTESSTLSPDESIAGRDFKYPFPLDLNKGNKNYNHFRILECADALARKVVRNCAPDTVISESLLGNNDAYNDLYRLSGLTPMQVATWFTDALKQHKDGYDQLLKSANPAVSVSSPVKQQSPEEIAALEAEIKEKFAPLIDALKNNTGSEEVAKQNLVAYVRSILSQPDTYKNVNWNIMEMLVREFLQCSMETERSAEATAIVQKSLLTYATNLSNKDAIEAAESLEGLSRESEHFTPEECKIFADLSVQAYRVLANGEDYTIAFNALKKIISMENVAEAESLAATRKLCAIGNEASDKIKDQITDLFENNFEPSSSDNKRCLEACRIIFANYNNEYVMLKMAKNLFEFRSYADKEIVIQKLRSTIQKLQSIDTYDTYYEQRQAEELINSLEDLINSFTLLTELEAEIKEKTQLLIDALKNNTGSEEVAKQNLVVYAHSILSQPDTYKNVSWHTMHKLVGVFLYCSMETEKSAEAKAIVQKFLLTYAANLSNKDAIEAAEYLEELSRESEHFTPEECKIFADLSVQAYRVLANGEDYTIAFNALKKIISMENVAEAESLAATRKLCTIGNKASGDIKDQITYLFEYNFEPSSSDNKRYLEACRIIFANYHNEDVMIKMAKTLFEFGSYADQKIVIQKLQSIDKYDTEYRRRQAESLINSFTLLTELEAEIKEKTQLLIDALKNNTGSEEVAKQNLVAYVHSILSQPDTYKNVNWDIMEMLMGVYLHLSMEPGKKAEAETIVQESLLTYAANLSNKDAIKAAKCLEGLSSESEHFTPEECKKFADLSVQAYRALADGEDSAVAFKALERIISMENVAEAEYLSAIRKLCALGNKVSGDIEKKITGLFLVNFGYNFEPSGDFKPSSPSSRELEACRIISDNYHNEYVMLKMAKTLFKFGNVADREIAISRLKRVDDGEELNDAARNEIERSLHPAAGISR